MSAPGCPRGRGQAKDPEALRSLPIEKVTVWRYPTAAVFVRRRDITQHKGRLPELSRRESDRHADEVWSQMLASQGNPAYALTIGARKRGDRPCR